MYSKTYYQLRRANTAWADRTGMLQNSEVEEPKLDRADPESRVTLPDTDLARWEEEEGCR